MNALKENELVAGKLKDRLGPLVTFNINRASHLMARRVNRELAKSGFSLQWEQLPVLFAVYFSSDDPLSQQDIANMLQKDKSGIQRSIKTLERDGYLRIESDVLDRRVNRIQLTPAGKMICELALDGAEKFNTLITEQFTKEETDLLLSMLRKIATILEN